MTLNEFCIEYWFPLCEKKLRPCTVSGYKSVWKCHIRDEIGEMELEEITPRAIDKWLGSQPKETIAYSCWHIARIAIRMAYKYEFIERDPSGRIVNVPKKPYSEQPTLSREEVDIVIDAFEGHELEAWLICAVTLGLRREEACALTWADIDLDTGAVTISRGAQNVDGELVIAPPKTRNGYRTVWLAGKYLERVRELGKGKPKDEWLTPYWPNLTAQRYKRHCLAKGVPYVPPKNLRTTFGTLAINDGWDVGRVAKWMGHYSPEVTMNNYCHTREEAVREVRAMWDDKILVEEPKPPSEPATAPEPVEKLSLGERIKRWFTE